MKTKSLLTLIICLACLAATAQEKTKIHKWQLGIQANSVEKLPSIDGILDGHFLIGHQKDKSYSFGLYGIYSLNESMDFRLRFSYTKRNIHDNVGNPDSNSTAQLNSIGYDNIKQNIFRFAPGVIWHINSIPFRLYGGFELLYTEYDKMNLYIDTKGYSNNIMTMEETWDVKIPKGYGVGIGSLIGFQVHLVKSFSIGTEFSYAYGYTNYSKGKAIRTVIDYYYQPVYPTGILKDSYDESIENYYKGNFCGSINLTYRF